MKPVPKQIFKKAKVRPTGKPVNAPVKSKSKSTRSKPYYIQVGSFVKTPSRGFLSIIKKSGFNYKITAKAANRHRRLLIGPYKNSASANKALHAVKELINKNAFVIKYKK